jgi:Na+-transporting methylmalonyl-CoA/oxaloacetate decarboxylase gamma subunit
MKRSKKIRIFAIMTAIIVMLFSITASAADKLDKNMSGADMSPGERFEYAIQGTVTGMLMIFAVLGLLWGIVSLSKVVFYDLPNKKKEVKPKKRKGKKVVMVEDDEEISASFDPAQIPAPVHDDGEIAAVITAAIAAMLDSEEYKNEFVGGFRVVSFKRSTERAWNKK